MDTKKVAEEIAGEILETNPYHDQRGKFTSRGGAAKVMQAAESVAKAHDLDVSHDTRSGMSTIHGAGGVGNWRHKIVVDHSNGSFQHVRRKSKLIGGMESAGNVVHSAPVSELSGYVQKNQDSFR